VHEILVNSSDTALFFNKQTKKNTNTINKENYRIIIHTVEVFNLLFSIDRRNNILLTVDGSSVDRRCETI
jgi:hypothetical protein